MCVVISFMVGDGLLRETSCTAKKEGGNYNGRGLTPTDYILIKKSKIE